MKKSNLARLICMVLALTVLLTANVFAIGTDQVSVIYDPVSSITYDFNDGAVPGLFALPTSNNARYGKMTFSEEVEGDRYLIFEDGNLNNKGQGRTDYSIQVCHAPMSIEYDFCIPEYTKTAAGDNIPAMILFITNYSSPGVKGTQGSGKTAMSLTCDKDENGDLKFSVVVSGAAIEGVFEDPLSFDTWYRVKIDAHAEKYQAVVSLYDSSGELIDKTGTITVANSTYSTDVTPDGFVGLSFVTGSQTANVSAEEQSKIYIDNFTFTRERFSFSSKPAISQDGDEITASVVVRNEIAEETTAPALILALFDAKGKLVGISVNDSEPIAARTDPGLPTTTNVAWPNGFALPAEATVTCTLPKGDAATASAYLWTDVDTGMQPYCVVSDILTVSE